MMLRTYRECAKVVTSFELQNTPIGGGHKHVGFTAFSAVEVKCVPQMRNAMHSHFAILTASH